MVYCSGSIGMDPETLKLVEGSVGDRAVSSVFGLTIFFLECHLDLDYISPGMLTIYPQAQALKNLSAVLEAAGSSIDNVVKVNVFLTDMADFAAINKVGLIFHLSIND